MLLRTRHILTNYMIKHHYFVSRPKLNINNNIDYDKYVQTVNTELKYGSYNTQSDLSKIQNNLTKLNQTINDQKYWIFHSVFLSYIGLFAYIFKM